ncbi:UNKNOWN [Stylonychia lemnae]|uniref:Uncharacterized protein n=1 Tax=Stylonychia lemnae TaxID=5949 RepID=A0A078AI86_STYLE|nr:UNKNOWN [Stylonychia lemnae]|eukprot:CDW81919.1 UNKNOWN [Stylonychia lemnae]
MTKDHSIYKHKEDFQFETLVIERPRNFNGNWLDLLQIQSQKLKQLIDETDQELKRRGIIFLNETNINQQHISSNVGNLSKSQEFYSQKFQATLMQQNQSPINLEENQDLIREISINEIEDDDDDLSDYNIEKFKLAQENGNSRFNIQLQNKNREGSLKRKQKLNEDLRQMLMRNIQVSQSNELSNQQTRQRLESIESFKSTDQQQRFSSSLDKKRLFSKYQMAVNAQNTNSQKYGNQNSKQNDKIRTMQTEISPDLQVSFNNQNQYLPPKNKMAERLDLFRNKLPYINSLHQRSLQVTPLQNNLLKSPMLRNSSRINSRYSHAKTNADQQNPMSRNGDLQNSGDQEIIEVPNLILGYSPLNKKYTDFLAKDEKEKYEKLQENKKNMKIAMKNIDFIAAVTKSFKSRISIGMATQGVPI